MTRVTISVTLDDSAPIDWAAVGAAVAAAGQGATRNRLGDIEHAVITGTGIIGDLHASEYRDDLIGRQVQLHSKLDRYAALVGTNGSWYVVRSDDGADVYVVSRGDFELIG